MTVASAGNGLGSPLGGHQGEHGTAGAESTADPPRPLRSALCDCGWSARGTCYGCNLVALKRAGVVRLARWSGPDMYRLPSGEWADYGEALSWLAGEGGRGVRVGTGLAGWYSLYKGVQNIYDA